MYEEYFGFNEKPFELTPDPTFLYLSPEIRETIATLKFCIKERRGFHLLVGEPGTGKTTMINSLIDSSSAKIKFAYVFNPAFDFHDLLQTVLTEFELAKEDEVVSKRKAIRRLNDYAINQYEKGKNTVIIVDEAQYLNIETLENLRLLSNLETRKHKLFQIIIAGQPELEHILSSSKLRQLTQRIGIRRKTKPLNEKECNEYIRHRLKVAGYSGPQLFANRAMQLIAEYSRGIPRTINILCDNAFLIAYATNDKRIDTSIVKEAIADLQTVAVDSDQKSASESNGADKKSHDIISKDRPASLTDEKQPLPAFDQENTDWIAAKMMEQADAPEDFMKSDQKKRKRKISFSRASIAILIAIFIVNLSGAVFYLWGKDRYKHGSNVKSERSADSALTVESETVKASKAEAGDLMVNALDAKLEGLYKKIEEMRIALEEKMKKNQEHQDEMKTSLEEKMKKNQERQDEMKTSLEEKLKKNQERQLKTSQVNTEAASKIGIEDNQSNVKEGAWDESAEKTKSLIVQKGESLNRILIREYGKLDDQIVSMVLRSNPEIKNPDHILENQIIRLPRAANSKFTKED
jgi:type II secretory pathway predicted ATPase ExeA